MPGDVLERFKADQVNGRFADFATAYRHHVDEALARNARQTEPIPLSAGASELVELLLAHDFNPPSAATEPAPLTPTEAPSQPRAKPAAKAPAVSAEASAGEVRAE